MAYLLKHNYRGFSYKTDHVKIIEDFYVQLREKTGNNWFHCDLWENWVPECYLYCVVLNECATFSISLFRIYSFELCLTSFIFGYTTTHNSYLNMESSL